MIGREIEFRLFVIALAFFQIAAPQGWGREAKSRSEPVNGLQISIYPQPGTTVPASSSLFRVELRNVGKDDIEPVVGARWPDGETLYAINLILTKPHGLSYRLFSEPRYVRGDDMVNLVVAEKLVPVPPGARLFSVRLPPGYWFSVSIDLKNYKYFSDVTGVHTLEPQPLPYTVQADLTGLPSDQFWSGIAQSNVLRIRSRFRTAAK